MVSNFPRLGISLLWWSLPGSSSTVGIWNVTISLRRAFSSSHLRRSRSRPSLESLEYQFPNLDKTRSMSEYLMIELVTQVIWDVGLSISNGIINIGIIARMDYSREAYSDSSDYQFFWDSSQEEKSQRISPRSKQPWIISVIKIKRITMTSDHNMQVITGSWLLVEQDLTDNGWQRWKDGSIETDRQIVLISNSLVCCRDPDRRFGREFLKMIRYRGILKLWSNKNGSYQKACIEERVWSGPVVTPWFTTWHNLICELSLVPGPFRRSSKHEIINRLR